MQFRYIGDKKTMCAFGYEFSGGAVVEVVEELVIAKLAGNRFFEAVKPAEKKPAKPKTDPDCVDEWPV